MWRISTHAVPVLPSHRGGNIGSKDGEDASDNSLKRRLERQNVGSLMQEEDFLEHERDQGLGLTGGETDDDSDGEVVLVVCDLGRDDATDEEEGA